jgi:hypothetical protein
MVTKKLKKFKETNSGKILLFLVKTPFYLYSGIKKLKKVSEEKFKEKKIKKKRKLIDSKYNKFKILSIENGNYEDWEKNIYDSDSKIGVILGSRGKGKTAFGVKFLENVYAKKKKRCYAMGFSKEEMPLWINVVKNINDLKNNSFVLIDEGGILFSSRNFMSSANKLLGELMLIARHKNLSILFISQNSSNLDINILRQADFLVLKPSSLLQKEFERKIIQKIYDKAEKNFKKFSEDKGLTHIYSGDFKGFVSNDLPSFWGEKISKGFS